MGISILAQDHFHIKAHIARANMGLDFVSGQYGGLFSRCRKYVINSLIHQNELIYVNYGRVDDYRYLEKINVNVSGKIVIARYGKIFRGDKVCYINTNHSTA
jgi:hypothetical protein